MLKAAIPQLGNLTADVWIDERHRREMEVTQNPVEYGAPITDHAFVKARKLYIRFGVSNTPLSANDSFTSKNRVSEAREKLYEMQDTKQLITVNTITGGQYKDCLLAGIGWQTDSSNPHSIIFDLDLEEIVITTTDKVDYQLQPPDPRDAAKTEGNIPRGTIDTNEISDKPAENTMTEQEAKNAAAAAKAEAAKATADLLKAHDKRSLLQKAMAVGASIFSEPSTP